MMCKRSNMIRVTVITLFLLSLFLLGFTGAVSAATGPVLSIPEAPAKLGDANVQVSVYLDSVGQDVYGVQFELLYDKDILEYISGVKGKLVGNEVYFIATRIIETGRVRAIIYSLSHEPIPAEYGQLVVFDFNIAQGVAFCDPSDLNIENEIIADALGFKIDSQDPSGGQFLVKGSIGSSPATVSLNVGGQQQLDVTTTPAGGLPTFTIDNPSVASVDVSGKITAKAAGSAKITISAGECYLDFEVPVSVSSPSPGPGPGPSSISLTVSPDPVNVPVGGEKQLAVTTSPADATLAFSSQDESIALVDGSGKVTGKAAGSTKITVNATRSGYSSASKTVDVVVAAPAPGYDCVFSDLPKTHWAYNIINELCLDGVVKGYPDKTFRPENDITRAEFIKIITGAFVLEENNTGPPSFSDVPFGAWYYGSIQAASAEGMVWGYGDGTFHPDQPITRQEMAVIIVRAMGLSGGKGNTKFEDDGDIAPWAMGYVVTAVKEGLVYGYPDNTFRPEENATRAEACALVYQLVNKIGN